MKKRIIIISLILCFCLVPAGCGDKEQADRNKSVYTDTVFPLERNGIGLHLDCMTRDGIKVEDNILLVHGLTYSSHEFDVDYGDYSLVRFLCDNGYAVWRIDVAGYGQSGSVENGFEIDSNYASGDVVAAIEKILAVTDADTIDLLGWSWGTVTGALAEEKCFDVIDKFVMYAPILTGLGEAEITDAFHKNTWEHAASDFQMYSDGSIDENITESAVVSTYCSNCWRYDGAKSPNGGRKDLCVDNSVELIDLSKIKNTTLVICGSNDPYMDMPQVNASLDSLSEDSELVIVDGASHCMMIEKPYYREFRDRIMQFLKK